jgi:ATP-dependent protease HslVU (ClpYQ) peptidase subunit
MTCIIGIQTEQGAWIGGDSCGSNTHHNIQSLLPKVFHHNGFLIGYTWSFRMGQILQYQLWTKKHKKKQTNMEYMVTRFVPAIRALFKENWKDHRNEGEEEGGQFLVAYHGNLYQIDSDFQVQQHANGIYAIGSGGSFAYGATLALNGKPEKRICKALEIASECNPYVAPPFVIEYQAKETSE